jgi:hypothetical protein
MTSEPMGDALNIGDEVESWLEWDIPGHVEHMIQIARVAERRRRAGGKPPRILVWGSWAYPIGHLVSEITPTQLRTLAEGHERASEELLRDATELRNYADDLEQSTPLGVAMLEHFRAIAEEEAHRIAVEEDRRRIANAADGILNWEAVDEKTRATLYEAGFLRVDDVRVAVRGGALQKADGIGPTRYTRIAVALAGGGA